jgi:hypothetical protein
MTKFADVRAWTIVSLLALGSAASHAATVFQNPWNSGAADAGAWSQPSQLLAGQFQLTQAAAVSGASWYGTMFSRDPLNSGDTWTFDLNFSADSVGAPGSLLASRAVTTSVTDTGSDIQGERAYRFDASFVDVALSGSTSYFLSIVNSGAANTYRWNVGTDSSYSGVFSLDHGVTWSNLESNRQPLNFELTSAAPAVPEPETYALLLVGLGALSLAARRRRA